MCAAPLPAKPMRASKRFSFAPPKPLRARLPGSRRPRVLRSCLDPPIMNPALLLLLRLQGKALWRRTTRGVRTAKGAMLFAFGFLMIVLWILPSVLTARTGPRTSPESVRNMVPFIMLGSVLLTLLTTGGEKAIPFHPAEVDMLFSAPFMRRQILAYKIAKTFAGALLSALLLSGVLLRHAGGWPQTVIALFLAMLFLHLLSISML